MYLLYLLLSLFSAQQDLPAFNQLADRTGMTFTQPAGWEEVPVVKNSQMSYDYAIKPTGKEFEIRYRIQPLDEMAQKYKEWQAAKPAGSVMIDPTNLYPGVMMAVGANIAGGKMPGGFRPYAPDAVKHDFGADKGGALMMVPAKEFGQGFKYCLMTTIHKADKSITNIFFMVNSEAGFRTYIPATMTALSYK
jgi:hypothetical protein